MLLVIIYLIGKDLVFLIKTQRPNKDKIRIGEYDITKKIYIHITEKTRELEHDIFRNEHKIMPL